MNVPFPCPSVLKLHSGSQTIPRCVKVASLVEWRISGYQVQRFRVCGPKEIQIIALKQCVVRPVCFICYAICCIHSPKLAMKKPALLAASATSAPSIVPLKTILVSYLKVGTHKGNGRNHVQKPVCCHSYRRSGERGQSVEKCLP